ncbi:hypothetical protein [Sporosarcina sp. FA9]|uniref:hypothetical protein n=1 Tax=Sporosarcina sp. FA9 TaxID=3413030 RepID=UPI003F655DA1
MYVKCADITLELSDIRSKCADIMLELSDIHSKGADKKYEAVFSIQYAHSVEFLCGIRESAEKGGLSNGE